MMVRKAQITREAAESIAISALNFVVEEPQRLGRFLVQSGLGPDTIRTAARDPQFLVGILEFLESDDRMLVEYAEQAGVDPTDIGRARDILGGQS